MNQQIAHKNFDVFLENKTQWQEKIYSHKTRLTTSAVNYNILTLERKT